jgi:hypothetical protein
MGMRTVRLDERTEKTLEKLRKSTGLTISEVLKRGVEAYAEKAEGIERSRPYDVFEKIELGDGGWALGRARDAKRKVRDAVARKHRR